MNSNGELFRISKYTYGEAFLSYQLSMAGASEYKLQENMEKNTNYLRETNVLLKIVITFYMAMMIPLPIQLFSNINFAVEQNIDSEWILFTVGGYLALFFLIQLLFLCLFGIILSAGLFSGDAFLLLKTLPLEEREVQKISFFASVRSMDLQLISMTLVLPIGVAIGTQHIILTGISLIISFLNVLFAFNFVLLVGNALSTHLRSQRKDSTIKRIFRAMIVLFVIIFTMIIFMAITLLAEFIQASFLNVNAVNNPTLWTTVLEWFPLQNAGAYLLTYLYISNFHALGPHFWYSLGGVLLFCGIIILMLRKTLLSLANVSREETTSKTPSKNPKPEKPSEIKVKVRSPASAFFRKDMNVISRDIQAMMFLIIPLFLKLLLPILDGEVLFGIAFYNTMSAYYVSIALTRLENPGNSIMVSLPYSVRDQVKGKTRWFYIIPLVTMGIIILILRGKPNFQFNLGVILIFLPLETILCYLVFEFKVFLFGKLRQKYVLEEVKLNAAVEKWVLLIVVGIIFAVGTLSGIEFFLSKDLPLYYLAFFAIPVQVLMGIAAYLIYNRMFPKQNFD